MISFICNEFDIYHCVNIASYSIHQFGKRALTKFLPRQKVVAGLAKP